MKILCGSRSREWVAAGFGAEYATAQLPMSHKGNHTTKAKC